MIRIMVKIKLKLRMIYCINKERKREKRKDYKRWNSISIGLNRSSMTVDSI